MADQIVALTNLPNQTLAITLSINSTNVKLNLTLRYNEMAGFWTMGIADQNGVPLVSAVPLITGQYPAANILAPYQYLQIGSAYVLNATGVASPDYPDDNTLGTAFQLLWGDQAV